MQVNKGEESPSTEVDPNTSYTIAVRILNSTTSTMQLVEGTCWKYCPPCYWTHEGDDNILHMGYSGTSGMLRYMFSDGDTLKIAVGVHNWVRWCDLDTVSGDESLMEIHPTYYDEDNDKRHGRLWAQASRAEATTAKGKRVELHYEPAEGAELRCFVKIT